MQDFVKIREKFLAEKRETTLTDFSKDKFLYSNGEIIKRDDGILFDLFINKLDYEVDRETFNPKYSIWCVDVALFGACTCMEDFGIDEMIEDTKAEKVWRTDRDIVYETHYFDTWEECFQFRRKWIMENH